MIPHLTTLTQEPWAGPDVFDVNSVLDCRRDEYIIQPAEKTRVVSIPGTKKKAWVRDGVEVISGGNRTSSTDVEVKSGSELTDSLKTEASAKAKYLAMSVEVGGGYSYDTTIKTESMYALMAVDHDQFYAYVHNEPGKDKPSLNPRFLEEVNVLPGWDQTEQAQAKYREFFNQWGTHVIRRTYYGCRFTMQVESQNASRESKEEYKANVKAEFGSVFSGGGSFTKGKSYNDYVNKRTTTVSLAGGSSSSSIDLQKEPGNKQLYSAWAKSIDNLTNTSVTAVKVEPLGALLHRCGEIRANDLTNALKFLIQTQPRQITVPGTLYSKVWKYKPTLTVEIWGDGFKSFRLDPLVGAKVEDTENSTVKRLVAPQLHLSTWRYHWFTSQVTVFGVVGKEISVGLSHEDYTKDFVLELYPPTGPIHIDFNLESRWSGCKLPSLLASGNYISEKA